MVTEAGAGRSIASSAASRPIRVLLAEDEENLGAILSGFLGARGHTVTWVRDGRAAVEELRHTVYDVVLLDVMMPEVNGLDVLRALTGMVAPPEAIVMTGNGTVDTALTAIQLGAYDYIAKPYRMAEVDLMIRRAAEKRALRLAAARARWSWRDASRSPAEFLSIHGELRKVVDEAASTVQGGGSGTWVVAGPPGSGRRALCRWLHAHEATAGDPLLLVELVGDVGDDTRSLMGHDESCDADDDIVGDRRDGGLGALEAAGGGRVVVDGWGRLDPLLRGALATAVVEGSHRRGGRATGASVRLDAKLCLCVDRLEELPGEIVDAADVVVQLPPLAARAMDLPLLTGHLLHGAAGGEVSVDDDAMALLATHAWPGNVAELRDVLAAALWHPTAAMMDGRRSLSVAALRLPFNVSTSHEGSR